MVRRMRFLLVVGLSLFSYALPVRAVRHLGRIRIPQFTVYNR
jgi:hypothetical protein